MTISDLRIANADVVLPTGVTKADLIVHDGRIAEIVQTGAPAETTSTLDAKGLHVFPGVVDPHVHLGPNITFPQSPEDAVPESQSASAGGVTTMLAYLMSPQPYHDVYPIARET
ncbi:MAG: dihydroorotase, partial [bacterium]|nr:dihydroorotase [bacterium]